MMTMPYSMADYGLQLPTMWVYVWYEDGTRENVANTDDLTSREAQEYHDRLEKARGKKVVRVTLESSKGYVSKQYRF